jgi:hypothetical protein
MGSEVHRKKSQGEHQRKRKKNQGEHQRGEEERCLWGREGKRRVPDTAYHSQCVPSASSGQAPRANWSLCSAQQFQLVALLSSAVSSRNVAKSNGLKPAALEVDRYYFPQQPTLSLCFFWKNKAASLHCFSGKNKAASLRFAPCKARTRLRRSECIVLCYS